MNSYPGANAEMEAQIRDVLGALRGTLTATECSEVTTFLDAREYGVALGTLSWILVEESKRIDPGILQEIDRLAAGMHLRDERFMYDLHNSYDRQRAA
ncbi:MAG TPA: MafI family immunity protein [Acetobacteraceae bacterium]|nr:MafI family immunity protein [Acetobacteraceae bacterium]